VAHWQETGWPWQHGAPSVIVSAASPDTDAHKQLLPPPPPATAADAAAATAPLLLLLLSGLGCTASEVAVMRVVLLVIPAAGWVKLTLLGSTPELWGEGKLPLYSLSRPPLCT
jgi:hypothetical protein